MSGVSTKKKGSRTQADRSDSTRQALIATGTHLFANKGFSEVSNRQLASAAGVNQALIGYHFGNKDGLYHAIFEQIAKDMGSRLITTTEMLGEERDFISTEVANLKNEALPTALQERCLNAVLKLIGTYAELLLEPGIEDYAKLIMREQFAPSPVFERLWEGGMGQMLKTLSHLVGLSRARIESNETDKITALMLMGQVLIFRVAGATVNKHLGWLELHSEEQRANVKEVLEANIRHILQPL